MSQAPEKMRLDKWLWAARFYKTRSLASAEVERNRVKVNDLDAKPARDVKAGDKVFLRRGAGLNLVEMTVIVKALSTVRGPAPVAQMLYVETPESIKAREQAHEERRMVNEPATSIEHGRPTKRNRRKLAQWDRWSVSIDE